MTLSHSYAFKISVQKYILFPYNKSQYTVKVEDWSRNAGKIIIYKKCTYIFSNYPLNSNYIWFISRNSPKNNKIIILSFIEFCVVFLYGIRKTKKQKKQTKLTLKTNGRCCLLYLLTNGNIISPVLSSSTSWVSWQRSHSCVGSW